MQILIDIDKKEDGELLITLLKQLKFVKSISKQHGFVIDEKEELELLNKRWEEAQVSNCKPKSWTQTKKRLERKNDL